MRDAIADSPAARLSSSDDATMSAISAISAMPKMGAPMRGIQIALISVPFFRRASLPSLAEQVVRDDPLLPIPESP